MTKCNHEDTMIIWKKHYNYIKYCEDCRTFWHVLGIEQHPIKIRTIYIHKYIQAYVAPLYKGEQ